MSERSSYGERFAFENPLGKLSVNRSTRNRSRKRRLQDESSCVIVSDDTDQPDGDQLPASVRDHTLSSSVGIEAPQVDVNETGEQELIMTGDDEYWDHLFDPEPNEPEECNEEDGGNTASEPLPLAESASSSLYEGSLLSLRASNVLIMRYTLRHNITQEALGDLLSLLRLHCPSPNQCSQSAYAFKKEFSQMNYPINSHYYCNSCLWSIDDPSNVQSCPNPSCGKSLVSCGKALSSFIQVEIKSQLKAFFERK